MGQKINFFHMLKATKITVFGLVLACVFCGNTYADGMLGAYYLYNPPSSSSSSASTPTASERARDAKPKKAGLQFGLKDCTVNYGFKDIEDKFRLKPSNGLGARYLYLLAAAGAVDSLPSDVIPCTDKIVVISKECTSVAEVFCDKQHDVWKLTDSGKTQGGEISDIGQCANNQKPSTGTWLDVGQWLVSAESGKRYYVKDGHAFGEDDDTFFMFSTDNWSTDICWVDPSAPSINSSDTRTEAVPSTESETPISQNQGGESITATYGEEDETLESSATITTGDTAVVTNNTATSTTNCNTEEGCNPSCIHGAETVEFTGGYCIAKTCKQNYYKVKNNNVYQGWCKYISCSADQEPNIDAQDMWDQKTAKCRARQSAETEVVQEPTEQPVVAEETSGDTTELPAAIPAAPSGPADGEPCTMSGAEIAEYRGGKCVAVECSPGFKPDGDNCVEVSGPCESLPDNATRGHRQYDAETESEKCIVDDCVDGYVVADDKLSCHEDYEALAEQAREREQSTGNKLLGAVGMGATGIGGSMLLSGMSETKSDEDAERAMKAYLSTFTCKYGNESVPGGTKNVEIPGGNELIQMYAEYVALANDLKVRKEALGMKPGIESEAILDSATSGLYDDVSTGKTKGAYASLARALSDPDSEDAKLWAAQREESDEKKKTGAIVAGIGAIGSLLGDIAINKIDWKAKQKKALRDLETSVANITPPKVKCPSEATGTYAPNCDCSGVGKNYNPNTNQCEEVETPRVVDTIDTPVAEVDTVDVVNEVASTATVERDDAANLSADAMFEFGKYELLDGAKTALDEFVNGLRKENLSGCTITVVGHTDTKGGPTFNQNLSEARARSVANYLERRTFEDVIETVNPSGQGETECKCGLTVKSVETYTNDSKTACDGKTPGTPVPDETAFAPCRRVVVSLECDVRSAVGANSTGGNLGTALGTVASIVTSQN